MKRENVHFVSSFKNKTFKAIILFLSVQYKLVGERCKRAAQDEIIPAGAYCDETVKCSWSFSVCFELIDKMQSSIVFYRKLVALVRMDYSVESSIHMAFPAIQMTTVYIK